MRCRALPDKPVKNCFHYDFEYNSGYKTRTMCFLLSASEQAFRAINTFKDEYLLDFINVEELSIRDNQDVDEKVVENG